VDRLSSWFFDLDPLVKNGSRAPAEKCPILKMTRSAEETEDQKTIIAEPRAACGDGEKKGERGNSI